MHSAGWMCPLTPDAMRTGGGSLNSCPRQIGIKASGGEMVWEGIKQLPKNRPAYVQSSGFVEMVGDGIAPERPVRMVGGIRDGWQGERQVVLQIASCYNLPRLHVR